MVKTKFSYFTVWWFSAVHLVNTNNHLFDTKSESQKGVFSGLTIGGDTSFKFTSTSSDNQYSTVSL